MPQKLNDNKINNKIAKAIKVFNALEILSDNNSDEYKQEKADIKSLKDWEKIALSIEGGIYRK